MALSIRLPTRRAYSTFREFHRIIVSKKGSKQQSAGVEPALVSSVRYTVRPYCPKLDVVAILKLQHKEAKATVDRLDEAIRVLESLAKNALALLATTGIELRRNARLPCFVIEAYRSAAFGHRRPTAFGRDRAVV